ncbi:hypothetical protein EG328_010327 [Venturia inaequalis]|uniref:Uncharacterized protein n=1 Tax=Venturia inaequalis TaxID=5025 RepID=A0A8H3V6T2_VENIN|nr:hypothetical protein EG328_010327 [Venturia inaequalis]
MTATIEPQPRSPEKHLFVTLKVDFSKLKDVASPSKLVTFKLNPEKLAAFTDDTEDDESTDSPEEEEEEPEKEEPPLEDHDTPLIRFRHNSDLTPPHHKLLSTGNTLLYRPRISNPALFEKYLDRHSYSYTDFKGLYFYIDHPASTTELEIAVTQWTELFLRIGREAGSMEHNQSSSGKTISGAKASQISFGQVALDQRPIEAIDLTEVGPKRQDLPLYRSPARGKLTLSKPWPVQTVTGRRDPADILVSEETPKFLALCINFNVPTPLYHYQSRYLSAPARIPIQLHTGDPRACFDFLTGNPTALPRIIALVLCIRHSQDPAHWMVLFNLFIRNGKNLQYLDVFFAPPAERGSFPRCGANPWCEHEVVLAVLETLAMNVIGKDLGKVKIGGLFTDLLASYMKLRLGEGKVSFYLPPGWEKPRPVVFFSSAEDCEKNAGIAGLSSGFVWKVDVAEPTGLSRFLEEHPNFGDRIDELSIRIYEEEGVQDWIDLFHALGRQATRLDNVRIYWDQLARATRGVNINVLSVDEGIIEGLASIKVRYSLGFVGMYAPLLVSSLEEKTGMVGRRMQDENHVLSHHQ